MSSLDTRDLTKFFRRRGSRDRVTAIDNVSLSVASGELVVLLGPSGCGKTTILRCMAGLESPDSGEIQIGDRVMYSADRSINVPVEKRNVSVIFQGYALWPHMTIGANLAYPLNCKGINRKAEVKPRVDAALQLVGLSGLNNEYPGTLSGGQQQRVSLARAVITDPPVILFDEPLSNVDAQVRHTLREELSSMHRRVGFSALYVTHDQEEALAIADRIVVLDSGKIVQQGSPEEIYNHPVSKYVAEFVGRANVFDVTVSSASASSVQIASAWGALDIDPAHVATDIASGAGAYAVIRPEDARLVGAPAPQATNVVSGTVLSVAFLGSSLETVVTTENAGTLRISSHASGTRPSVGDNVHVELPRAALRVVSR